MNRIIRESKWILGRSKLFTLLLFILVNSALTVTIFSRMVSSEISADADDYKKRNEDNCYYRLLDDLEGEDGKRFERSAQCTNKQFRFLAELQDSKDLEYYICGDNSSVGIVDFKGNEKTKRNYENGGSSEYVFDNITYTDVKTMFVSKNVSDGFDVKMSSGEWFDSNDYDYNNETVSCILGNEYEGSYKIGDLIKLKPDDNNEFNIKQLRVRGFLKEDSYINNGTQIKLLNRYMLIPSRDIAVSQQSRASIVDRYIKLTGIIKTERPVNEINDIVKQYMKSAGIPDGLYYVVSSTNNNLKMFNMDIARINELLGIITVFLNIFCFFLVLTVTILFINRNTKYFATLSICGFRRSEIYGMICFTPIVLYSLGYIISVIVNAVYAMFTELSLRIRDVLLILAEEAAVLGVVCIVCVLVFRSKDLAVSLRRR